MVKKSPENTTPAIVDNVEALEAKLAQMREAQALFATYTQEQVDKIFYEAAMAANKARIPLAKMAIEETGRGVLEDKVIKNHYAAEYIYNAYKNTKTCGVLERDEAYGITKIAEPIGIVGAVIPDDQPHLHRDLQDADQPEDPQRHHHLPAPGCRQVHHRRRQARA